MQSAGQYLKTNYFYAGNIRKLSSLLCCLACIPLLYGCGPWHLPAYGYVAGDDPPLKSIPVLMPENAPSIPQGFKPVFKNASGIEMAGHEGIDIKARKNTPVIAAAPGTLMDSSWGLFYGHQVIILHDTKKEGYFVQSYYWHLNERLFQIGDKVKRGQQIGTLGSTGLLASYPHLHFEVRISEIKDKTYYSPVNPHRYWTDGAGKVSCYDISKDYNPTRFSITYPVLCE